MLISVYIIGHRFVSKVCSYIREEKCLIDVVGTYPLLLCWQCRDTACRVRIIVFVSRFYLPLRPLRSLREVCLIAVMIFFARRLRGERRVLFADVFHAGAGGVANFVTTRVRRGESD